MKVEYLLMKLLKQWIRLVVTFLHHRETGLGGLAGTPTGEAIKRKIFGTAEDMVKNN